MFPCSPVQNSTTALALMVWLSAEFLQGWFMLQESVFHSEPTPFNGTMRNWPHQSCKLGWDMVCQGWPRPCGSVNAQISCAASMSKAWTMLFPWNGLIYCFILLTVTCTRAWLTYLLTKTFYSLIVASSILSSGGKCPGRGHLASQARTKHCPNMQGQARAKV